MFDITFYNISKKANSTKQPTGGMTKQFVFKADSSVLKPRLEVNFEGEGDAPSLNYAYIPMFGRYYFVRDWSWERGLWTAYLDVDPMASFKSYIGEANEYVLRSSAQGSGTIFDGLRAMTGQHERQVSTQPTPWATTEPGFYVVGIVGKNADSGGVAYYIMSEGTLTSLLNTGLYDDDLWDYEVEDDSNVIAEFFSKCKQLVKDILYRMYWDPVKYITMIKYFPVKGMISGNSTEIYINWQGTGMAASRISPRTSEVFATTMVFDIPKHPQGVSEQYPEGYHYVNLDPFTRYTLCIEPFGMVPLPADKLWTILTLDCQIVYDLLTGQCRLTVVADGNVITEAWGTIGFDVQIARLSTPLATMAQAGSSLAQSAVNLDFGTMVGNSGDLVSATLSPSYRVAGATGGGKLASMQAMGIGDTCYLIADFQMVTAGDNPDSGTPLCQRRLISSLPGYIQCRHGDIDVPCYEEEREIIKKYMEEGFFYE